MNDALVAELAREAMMLALLLGGPLLVAALGVGLAISVFQAVTSIQEQTLSFVPKLIVVGLCFLALLPWSLQTAVKYTVELFLRIPAIVN